MQLTLRRQGNERYRQGQLQPALESYTQAKAILDMLLAHNDMEQHEIRVNQSAICLNLAAVHLGLGLCSQAAGLCTEALTAVPDNTKAYIRRAKAYMGLHEYRVGSPSSRCLYACMLSSIQASTLNHGPSLATGFCTSSTVLGGLQLQHLDCLGPLNHTYAC